MLKNHVLPAFGELRLLEVTVPRLDRFFPQLQKKTSAAHARTARAVVGGILRYAARHGAITTNPIRDVEPIEGSRKKKARALTAEERREWLGQLELDPKAVEKDLPDLTRFMLATGVRIGEALALYWEDVFPDAGTVWIRYTVVRVTGVGLVRRPPKTESGDRVLALPSWAVEMLRQRRKQAEAENRPPIVRCSLTRSAAYGIPRILAALCGTLAVAMASPGLRRTCSARRQGPSWTTRS